MTVPLTESSIGNQPGRIITFYSYKGGTGRTMTVANVAWILASNGKRVLAVDWDLESPGLHRYFHPFLADKQLRSSSGVLDLVRQYAAAVMDAPAEPADAGLTERYANVLHHAFSLDWPFPGGGFLDFLPAGQQSAQYGETVSTFDWNNFYDRLHGGVFLKMLRNNMAKQYDYVLIDSRTGLSDTAGICTVILPDIIADCFTMSTQSIDGAAGVAHSILKQRTEPVRILPVPMRIEDAEQLKLEAGRDYARQRFESFLTDLTEDELSRYWADVEIPYKSFYAYEEILAPFGDRPHGENSLLAAFERLTRVITQGDVAGLRPMAERDRRRILELYERPKQAIPTAVLISCAAVERVWAEWVAAQLDDFGVRTFIQEVDSSAGSGDETARSLDMASRALVLLSQSYVKATQAKKLWNLLAQKAAPGGRFVVPIRLDGVRLPHPFAECLPVDLAGIATEERARDLVLAQLDVSDVAQAGQRRLPDAARQGPRFPATPPPVWNAPQRNATFTGRTSLLEDLRDRLAGSVTVVVPQALYGLGGVGKTQVAVEYAYRFAAYYDIVWWVPSEQSSRVPAELAALADRLQVPAGERIRDKVEAVLDWLRQGRPSPRWLLVFDNAGSPEELREYNLPAGPGHVLITSRDQTWTQHASSVEVGVFEREESIRFLRMRLPSLSIEGANLVAEKLGDLPLAVEQAGAWLAETGMEVQQYMELLDSRLTEILELDPRGDYERSVTATWLVSLERLRERMPAAAKLLEVCAFFGPEPIPMSLVNSRRFVNVLLPFNPSLHVDLVVIGQLVRGIGRYALARIDSGHERQQPSLQLHRLVQAVIRRALSPDEQVENQHHVHEILASVNPGDPDKPENWPVYAGLYPHVEPPPASDALGAENPEVRRLVLDMVRFLWKSSDDVASQRLAERALSRWVEASGEDDAQVLLLRFHLANSLRSQAKFAEAYAVDEDVHRRLTGVVGEDHPYTIMAASSLAVDLRVLGQYQGACDLDEQTYSRFLDVFGDDHVRTLMAANNLAVSLRLVGDLRRAREIDESTLERRRAVLGWRHPDTLLSATNFGRDLRELGEYGRSRDLLQATVDAHREVLGHVHPATLRAARNLAITLRKLGQLAAAHALTLDTMDRLVGLRGRRHPETLACLSNLACDQSALGNDTEALDTARSTHEVYGDVLGEDHPFTLACANNVAIFTRKLGDPEEAAWLSEQVVNRLSAALGPAHPNTLACVINLANGWHDMGRHTEAWQLDEETYRQMCAVLDADHPDTLAVANNLVVSRKAVGDRDGARALFEEVLGRSVAKLGDGHSNTMAVRGGVRLNCDIDPPSP